VEGEKGKMEGGCGLKSLWWRPPSPFTGGAMWESEIRKIVNITRPKEPGSNSEYDQSTLYACMKMS
jgi:hypothetical protein